MALPFSTARVAAVRITRKTTAAIQIVLQKKSSCNNRNLSIRKRSKTWRGVGKCGTRDWSEGNAMVEEEVFQFMEVSNKPHHFPTKRELLDAGRSDLVSKILAHGGWLAAGWDEQDSETLNISSDNGGARDMDNCNEDALPTLDSDSVM